MTPAKRRLLEDGLRPALSLSPTANLPNMVRDGGRAAAAPTPPSGKKRAAAASDWLTNLSRDCGRIHWDHILLIGPDSP